MILKRTVKVFAWSLALCVLVVVGIGVYGVYGSVNQNLDMMPWNHPSNSITYYNKSQPSTDVKGNATKSTTTHKGSSGQHLVAPADAKAVVMSSDDKATWMTGQQWNAFVKKHPNYLVGVQNGQYIAEAPNLAQEKNDGNFYFVCDVGNSDKNMPYGSYVAQRARLLSERFIEIHHGNRYVLLAPKTTTTFPDGYTVTNHNK